MNIRYMQLEDVPFIEEALRSMWLKHSDKHPNLISSNTLSDTNVADYLSPFISKIEGFVLVAEVSKKVVGMVKIEEQKLEDFYNEEQAYFIDDLVVLDGFRRQGVASSLMEKVFSIAKDNNIKMIKSRVYSFNGPAQKTFLSNGFENLYSEYVRMDDSSDICS